MLCGLRIMDSGAELAVGLNKGHRLTRLPKRVKPSHKKGRSSKRVKFIREIIKEVVGLAPYEKRGIEYLRIGKEKKCTKFLKKRLGSLKRAKRKRDEISSILLQMNRQRQQQH